MHQQFQVKLNGTISGSPGKDGPPPPDDGSDVLEVDADPLRPRVRALADLAQAIAGAGISIRAVTGEGIETSGFVKLAVDDADVSKLIAVLERSYKRRYTIWSVRHGHIPDEAGSLAAFASKIADEGLAIDSIMIGTPERTAGRDDDDVWNAGDIPIQVTTIQAVADGAQSQGARAQVD
jgi:hypothetical protein